ncbi:CARM1 [Acanthosepion pharaonis]|uniref:CARM1 n=1 Tax=Acanthosepion pharaonis TaxID=158019 RepID=A0A812CT26_ACAPH|nr:CARM1 [Sepia pharaonis]
MFLFTHLSLSLSPSFSLSFIFLPSFSLKFSQRFLIDYYYYSSLPHSLSPDSLHFIYFSLSISLSLSIYLSISLSLSQSISLSYHMIIYFFIIFSFFFFSFSFFFHFPFFFLFFFLQYCIFFFSFLFLADRQKIIQYSMIYILTFIFYLSFSFFLSLTTIAPINPGSIPSVVNPVSNANANRTSIGGGISPASFSSQNVITGGTSHYPVSNQFMIGDYVMPGNVVTPANNYRKSEATMVTPCHLLIIINFFKYSSLSLSLLLFSFSPIPLSPLLSHTLSLFHSVTHSYICFSDSL